MQTIGLKLGKWGGALATDSVLVLKKHMSNDQVPSKSAVSYGVGVIVMASHPQETLGTVVLSRQCGNTLMTIIPPAPLTELQFLLLRLWPLRPLKMSVALHGRTTDSNT